jgi:dihydrofolate synthase/folylpolyglutamate synthase
VDFDSCLRYLHDLGSEIRPGAKFSLHEIRALLAELNDPQLRFRSVHVAGTNGKGSTAATIESIARHAGLSTALYTSPHLQRVTERIRIAGAEIQPDAFAAAFTSVYQAVERLLAAGLIEHPPSFFEFLTATAFQSFAAHAVELAIVEVGMGGRLDATNILRPAVSVITPVGLDHERYLGTTVAEIAGEKAGILKPGVTAVIARQNDEAEAVLLRRAIEAGSPVVRPRGLETGRAKAALEKTAEPGLYSFNTTWRGDFIRLSPALRGRHQVENALSAVRACEVLAEAGYPIAAPAVQNGIANVVWPGRLEKVHDSPEVFLDGAHNPQAAKALAGFLEDLRAAGRPRPILIYGSMRDKAISEIADILFPWAEWVVATAPAHGRAASPLAIAEIAAAEVKGDGKRPCRGIFTAATLAEAWQKASELAGSRRPIIITGSLYLAGEAREFFLCDRATQSGAANLGANDFMLPPENRSANSAAPPKPRTAPSSYPGSRHFWPAGERA